MKNLLFIIVAASLYLHFNPSSELSKKYDEYKTIVLDYMSDNFGTKSRLKASVVYDSLSGNLKTFRPEEINHLKEITLNRSALMNFYRTDCEGENRAYSVFLPENLAKVCKTIDRYKSKF